MTYSKAPVPVLLGQGGFSATQGGERYGATTGKPELGSKRYLACVVVRTAPFALVSQQHRASIFRILATHCGREIGSQEDGRSNENRTGVPMGWMPSGLR